MEQAPLRRPSRMGVVALLAGRATVAAGRLDVVARAEAVGDLAARGALGRPGALVADELPLAVRLLLRGQLVVRDLLDLAAAAFVGVGRRRGRLGLAGRRFREGGRRGSVAE